MSLVAAAQNVGKSRSLHVTVNKTTNLVFPAAIISVDRGSERILVQKSTATILRVKADSVFSDTTNLSVITSDGRLYSFIVSFHSSPDILNLDLGVGELVTKDTALARLAASVLNVKNNLYGFRYSDGNVQLSLTGVYTNKDQLICKLRIENNSSLSFDVGSIRFHIANEKVGKRRAVQETEVLPLFTPLNTSVNVRQSVAVAVILPKIAVSQSKVLKIDVNEKSGERHLSLPVPAKYILNAPPTY